MGYHIFDQIIIILIESFKTIIWANSHIWFWHCRTQVIELPTAYAFFYKGV